MWELIALAAAGAVLVIAYCGVGRPLTYVFLAFAAFVVGGLLIVFAPAPPGYTSEESNQAENSSRSAYMSVWAPRASGLLWAFGAGSLIAAAGFRHSRHSASDEELEAL
jgi:hypothetical protein